MSGGQEAALPRKLGRIAARTRVLEETRPDRLLAVASSRRAGAHSSSNGNSTVTKSSKLLAAAASEGGASSPVASSSTLAANTSTNGSTVTGAALPRESIAALYSLATRLHSPALVFHAKGIETSTAKRVTTEQIWGQMSVLLRPVLRRLQDNVRHCERVYGKGSSSGGGGTRTAAATAAASAGGKTKTATGDAADSHGDDELSESDLDEAISGLLQEQRRRKKAKVQKRGGAAGGNDDWRYAFGRGGEEDDADADMDALDGDDGDNLGRAKSAMDAIDDWGDGEEARGRGDRSDGEGDDNAVGGGELGSGSRRARDRNARAMLDAGMGDDDDDNGDDDEAALREMYGDDFADDGDDEGGRGPRLMGGADADLEQDLYYDDPTRINDGSDNGDNDNGEFDEYRQGQEMLYNEERDGGRFWGKDDMLNEEEAINDYGGGGGGDGDHQDGEEDGGGVDAAPYDEELERALADPSLTALERERLIEKAHVGHLEQKRLFGTDWAMSGETAARKRPREALLEVENLDFDYGMKAVPVITEGFTAKLEDRIKQRVLDSSYDNVVRRSAMTNANDLTTTRRDAVLDSEKSKLSLMDLYEKEYTDKLKLAEAGAGGAASAEPLTEIERDELRAINMWKRLSQHLDALSNFYYTPKPVQQDLEARVRAVDGAAPAIAMESVGNFAATRESALAPQDLHRASSRRFGDVGAEELTPQERKALRRSKKDDGKKFKDRSDHRKGAQRQARADAKKAKA